MIPDPPRGAAVPHGEDRSPLAGAIDPACATARLAAPSAASPPHPRPELVACRFDVVREAPPEPDIPPAAGAAPPGLEGLFDAGEIEHRVREHRGAVRLPAEAMVRAIEVECLRHRPGRHCLVRYRVHAEDPAWSGVPITRTIYAKAYAPRAYSGPLGEYVHQVLKALWEHPERPASLGVPRPIAYLRDTACVWQEEWPGERIGGGPGHPDVEPGPSRTLAEIARLLAGLHTLRSLKVRLRPARSASRALEDARADALSIAQVHPAVAPRLERTVERLVRAVPPPRRAPRAVLHGDFGLTQVLRAADGRLAVVDLDGASRGDPHHDLGGFLASYRYRTLTRGWSSLSVDDGVEQFLDTYQRAVPWRCDASRLAWYLATFLLTRVRTSLEHPETDRGHVERAIDLISTFANGRRP